MATANETLTLEKLKELLPSVKACEFSGDLPCIVAYDENALSHENAEGIRRFIAEVTKKPTYLVGYDSCLTDNPFHIYEVKTT